MIEIILVILALLLIIIIIKNKNKNTYISKSNINGSGLFANKSFTKGDYILNDLFPHKKKHKILYSPIPADKFNKYMSEKTSKINHCGSNDNASVYTNDHKQYILIAKKNIKHNDEITVDYDKTHELYPFIGGSEKFYNKC